MKNEVIICNNISLSIKNKKNTQKHKLFNISGRNYCSNRPQWCWQNHTSKGSFWITKTRYRRNSNI